MMDIFLKNEFLSAQQWMQLLFAGAVAAFVISILFAVCLLVLHNALPAKAAKRMLIAQQIEPIKLRVTGLQPLEEDWEPEQEKRPLLTATISEDAQKFLDKLAVQIPFDELWQGNPCQT